MYFLVSKHILSTYSDDRAESSKEVAAATCVEVLVEAAALAAAPADLAELLAVAALAVVR